MKRSARIQDASKRPKRDEDSWSNRADAGSSIDDPVEAKEEDIPCPIIAVPATPQIQPAAAEELNSNQVVVKNEEQINASATAVNTGAPAVPSYFDQVAVRTSVDFDVVKHVPCFSKDFIWPSYGELLGGKKPNFRIPMKIEEVQDYARTFAMKFIERCYGMPWSNLLELDPATNTPVIIVCSHWSHEPMFNTTTEDCLYPTYIKRQKTACKDFDTYSWSIQSSPTQCRLYLSSKFKTTKKKSVFDYMLASLVHELIHILGYHRGYRGLQHPKPRFGHVEGHYALYMRGFDKNAWSYQKTPF